MKDSSSILHIVATPIGNTEDITLRAIKVLENTRTIICEDTRNAKKLFNLLNISLKGKTFISYYKGKESLKLKKIIEIIKEKGEAALISDAGTPLVSDPGYLLIKEAIKQNIKIIPVPGPSSVLAAIMSAGIKTENGFVFLGFLPNETEKKKRIFYKYLSLPAAVIFFESPRRIKESIKLLSENFGEREIAICRELTKVHEEISRGKAKNIWEAIKERDIKGEIVVIVEGESRERMPKSYEEIKQILFTTTTLSEKKIEKILKNRK